MPEDRVDFAQIPRSFKEQAKKEAKRYNLSLDTIAEFLLKRWFDLPVAVRARELEKLPRKVYGRPI